MNAKSGVAHSYNNTWELSGILQVGIDFLFVSVTLPKNKMRISSFLVLLFNFTLICLEWKDKEGGEHISVKSCQITVRN